MEHTSISVKERHTNSQTVRNEIITVLNLVDNNVNMLMLSLLFLFHLVLSSRILGIKSFRHVGCIR